MAADAKHVRTLPWKDNIGYCVAATGQAYVYGMVALYLTYFYTDYLKIGAAMAGTVFLIARLWDAFNDPIMGYIVDRTNTRWGRFRPYILFGAVPFAVFLALCFYAPDLSLTGRIIWAFATYIPLGMFQTLLTIPWHAQTVVITTDPAERSEIAGVFSIVFQAAYFMVAALAIPIKHMFPKDIGFFYTAAIFGAIGTVCWYICFAATKKYDRTEIYQRLPVADSKLSDVKARLKVVTHNRPFVFLMLAFFANQTATAITQATIIYFFRYYLKMEWLFPLVMGGFAALTAAGAMIMSLISRKKGKKKIYQLSNLIFAGLMLVNFLIYWAAGPQDTYSTGFIVFMVVLILIVAFFNGPITALVWSMLPDTVEHGEWKVGVRSEGILYSVFSFMMKSGLALGGALTGFLLAAIKYVPDQAQSGGTLFGFLLMLFVCPAIMQILSFVAIVPYDLDEEKHRKIVEELKQKHSAR